MSVITIVGITLGVLIAVCITWIGFPGTFLIAIVSLIWGWMTGFHSITVGVILALFGVSILLEIMELVLGGLAAQYYGASKRSAVCAIIGGIFGTIIGAGVLFLIGAFVGLLAGSYLGAFLSEAVSGKSILESNQVALGTVLGNVAGKGLKSTAVIFMGIWIGTLVTP